MPNSSDVLVKIFGMSFMDDYHMYGGSLTNVRYYHRQKAAICNRFITAHAAADKAFLDAGAGRGPYTHMAQGLYRKIYCFEFDAAELSAAKEQVHPSSDTIFEQVDLTNIPLGDNAVDVAVCSEVVEHIPDQQLAMKELYRVLKPGGVMLFSMPNKNSLFYRKVMRNSQALLARDVKGMTHSEWESWRHMQFGSADIERLATEAGFVVTGRDSANALPLPNAARVFLMEKFPLGFRLYNSINRLISRTFPRWGSFYFLSLKK